MKYNSSNFALLMAFTHGTDHFARRMIPPLIPLWAFFFRRTTLANCPSPRNTNIQYRIIPNTLWNRRGF